MESIVVRERLLLRWDCRDMRFDFVTRSQGWCRPGSRCPESPLAVPRRDRDRCVGCGHPGRVVCGVRRCRDHCSGAADCPAPHRRRASLRPPLRSAPLPAAGRDDHPAHAFHLVGCPNVELSSDTHSVSRVRRMAALIETWDAHAALQPPDGAPRDRESSGRADLAW